MRSALDRMYDDCRLAGGIADDRALIMVLLSILGRQFGFRPGDGCLRWLHDGGRRIPRACPHTQARRTYFA